MIDLGANCYFSSTAIFNNKNIMATDVFNLNEACPVILLDTELSTTDIIFKDLMEFGMHWCTVRIHCGRPCIITRMI